MHAHEKLVRDMYDAWTKLDPGLIVTYFTDDAIWHNMMADPIQGRDALLAAISSGISAWTRLEVKVTTVLIDGDAIATERVDRIEIGDDNVTAPVAAFIIVENGKVKVWRDYFDLQSVEKGLNQSLW